MGKFYLTTAIDYANGDPHIGHAYEKIGADTIARYRRMRGDDVYFLTGLDEHGQKVAQAAAERGVSPQQFVDGIAGHFEEMWRRLSISYDRFMRTTGDDHKRGVRALIKRIHDSSPDDFYEKSYEGWYCVGCELFKRDDEIESGHCVLHPTRELQWTTERNWFFRLTRYEPFLRRLFAERPEFLEPETRRNEILSLLDQGLEDISITRSRLSWAIPFPLQLSNGEEQGTWVWFDALPNYLTATGFPEKRYHDRWPAQLHVIGKDITRLHTVVWPAMLQAAELPLPDRVWAHGFVLLGGERFSKSAGVRLDVDEAIDRYGADALRYFLLREVAFDTDGSFSFERYDERYTADLANSLGNLASRAIAMVEKYCEGVVPSGSAVDLDRADAADLAEYHARARWQPRLPAARRPQARDVLRVARQRIRPVAAAVGAREKTGVARRARTRAGRDRPTARPPRDSPRAVHAEQGAGTLDADRRPGPSRGTAIRLMSASLDVAGWHVAKGPSLFPRPEAPTPLGLTVGD